jgi:hypothetical protein
MKIKSAWRILLILSLAAAPSLLACGQKSSQPTKLPPAQVHWSEVRGASSYLVRAWSGYRLLFAENSSDTTLTLTENMQRVLAGCDSVSLEVKALDAANAPLDGGHRRYELGGFKRGR